MTRHRRSGVVGRETQVSTCSPTSGDMEGRESPHLYERSRVSGTGEGKMGDRLVPSRNGVSAMTTRSPRDVDPLRPTGPTSQRVSVPVPVLHEPPEGPLPPRLGLNTPVSVRTSSPLTPTRSYKAPRGT